MIRILAMSALLASTVFAGEFVLTSPPTRVHLLELFTSEGCSSCPPADDWMRGLAAERGLWRDFVPVAFHVDYWDYLGWRDRLASPRYTQRQRAYAALWRSETVYTPGFVLDGREWRARTVPQPSAEKAGVLRLRVNNENASVEYDGAELAARKLSANLAWLGGRTESNVRAGENSGRKLQHAFTALALESQPLTDGRATFPANRPAGAEAVAVWISEAGKAEPRQALGGPLSAPRRP